MIYKRLSLAARLLPFFGYGKNEALIKQLKYARYKKMIEISALRKTTLEIQQAERRLRDLFLNGDITFGFSLHHIKTVFLELNIQAPCVA